MDQGGYGALEKGEGSFRDILKNKAEAVSLEQENRVVKNEDVTERLIGEYEARLQTEPNNLKLIRQLADLYRDKKDFDKALELYARIKTSEMGSDPSLETAIASTMVKKFDHQISTLNPFAADHADQVAQVAGGEIELSNDRMPETRGEISDRPAIRYEMGVLYFQAGKINEAMQEFQKAQNNPHKKIAAMSYLAQCFAKKKMYDSAVRTFQNVIKEKLAFDEEKKDLVYNLGCVLEIMGKKAEAHRTVPAHLRNRHGLQGCLRQGGCVLRGAVKICRHLCFRKGDGQFKSTGFDGHKFECETKSKLGAVIGFKSGH